MNVQLIVVAGPTASGKTSLGIELARRFNGAVISADSRMVYRGLDIGTGKPTWEHRVLDRSPWTEPRLSEFGPVYSIGGVDHYGLDLVDPESRFTLTDWLAFARPLISNLATRNIQPIIVGGTGLYLRALVRGLEPAPTDPELRASIEALSTDEIRAALAMADPETVNREPGNRRRLIRALEIVRLTGKSIGEQRISEPLDSIIIAPELPRDELYRRIDQRLHERFEAGLIDEVRSLIESGVSTDWLKSLGLEYRFVTEWLENVPLDQFHSSSGIGSMDNLEKRLAAAIHHYARRQLTFLRHQVGPVQWVRDVAEALAILSLLA